MELYEVQKELSKSIDLSIEYILQNQRFDTYWQGDIYYNAYPTAVAVLVNKILGISEPEWEKKAVKWIEEHQNKNGSWGMLDKPALSHPNISEEELDNMLEIKSAAARNTVVCLLVLELAGGSADLIRKGQKYMETVNKKYIDPFTEIFLACFNRVKWSDIKIPPIEILLMPENSKFGVKKFIPAWVRDGAVGGILLKTLKEGRYMKSPLRKAAISKAVKMLLNNQLSNGAWFGTFQPTVYPLLALVEYGYDLESNKIQKGLYFLRTRRREDNGYVHRFWLPIWDTGLTLLALKSAGLTDCHKNVDKAKFYLINSRFKNGSWGYCPEVEIYPDCDDTSVAMQALSAFDVNKNFLDKSALWLLDMQNSDGGWAAFIKNQAEKKPGTLPTTIEDSMVILKDPSIADITGHVLRALGEVGYTVKHPSIKRAINFLKKDQLSSGAWYGRWGLCYIYAVTRVLKGLEAVGENMKSDYVKKAVQWLIEHQNEDGGWGEHYISYFKEKYAGIGRSTPVQTGWVLSTLISLLPVESKIIKKGIRYLLDTQLEDGNWSSPHTVGALEIYENTNYSSIFPLMAIGEYRKTLLDMLH